ncbi:MAG TPA: hypothetical protein VJC05_02900 [Candidatus Andersenbacteria bacterium]|nr:hypothetical protein [Candidatus Andersenbacteria bacterium]
MPQRKGWDMKHSLLVAVLMIASVAAVAGAISVSRQLGRPTGTGTFSSPSHGLFGQQCEGKKVGKLDTFPIDPDAIELIVPMGRVQDSHVTPTDHQYIIPKGATGTSLVTSNPKMYQIKAPADGYIINIELFKEPVEQAYRGGEYADNYLVIFEHSCNWYTRLIHIDTLSDNVLAGFEFENPHDPHPFAQTRIAVKEGEVIGTVGPHSFDFQIMDVTNQNKNIVSPDNIDHFSSYTVDTFDYVTNALKEKLLSKNLRRKPPLGGKIGYDVPGTLAGNWFKVGRNKNQREEYWTNNLSIVYDHLDDSQIRISLGDYNGFSQAYGVRGNAPDPTEVTKNSGPVSYELLLFEYVDQRGQRWDQIHFVPNLTAKNIDEARGVVLLELQNDDTLKVEVFPQATSTQQVSGFTARAVTYER